MKNTQLISQEPELLRLLSDALNEHDKYESGERLFNLWVDDARKIINKLKGE